MTEVRLCPGWKGNKGRCGKGEPRALRPGQDVCGSCRRAMERAGTRESERQRAEREQRERYEAQIKALAARVDAEQDWWMSNDGPARLLVRIGELTQGDLNLTSTWGRERLLVVLDRWNVLRALTGLPIEHGRRL